MKTLLPNFILDLHAICNQSCAYCIARDPWDGTFGSLASDKHRNVVEKFFSTHGPFNIVLTGGEPLITPNIESFLQALTSAGHTISLQTNLRLGIDKFKRSVSSVQTGWILATLHSVAHDQRHVFAATVRKLRASGYPVVAKIILDLPTLLELESLYDLLAETGAGVLLSPLVIPAAGADEIPVAQYSPSEWKRIAPRLNLLSAWLFFSGGFISKGHSCQAGSRSFYGRLSHGKISGCAHSFPEDLGHIAKGAFTPVSQKIACDLARCCCDFNTYTGLIDGLDDRQGFDALRSGVNDAVPANCFADWIYNAGVKPVLNLPGVNVQNHDL